MLQTITFIIMTTYLIFQSIEDYKNMQVYVFPNNVILSYTIISYFIEKIIVTRSIMVPLDVLMTVMAIIILSLFHLYASGDMKALISIFFALRYTLVNTGTTIQEPNLFVFLIFLLITNTFFSLTYIYRRIKQRDRCNKKMRVAYFPYLTIGYVLTSILFYVL